METTPVDSPSTPVVGRRRGKLWHPVGHGLHRPRLATDERTPEPGRPAVGMLDDLRAWHLLLPPSGCFTHLTAAILHHWWLPPLPQGLPVFVSQVDDEPRMCRPQVRVSRHRSRPQREHIDGLPVASAEEVLLACARDLSLIDLVVLIDAALHHGDTTVELLTTHAEQRRRGAPLLRRAIRLADGRSESLWETLLRLLHECLGIPVEPQHEVFDTNGQFVARGDLWLVGTTTLHEFDGAHHLARPQQSKDLRRARRIGNQAWQRRGYTSDDVVRRPVTILRDADLAVGRPHRPERIRAWHAWLRDSLFTPAGLAAFSERIGIVG